MSRLPTVGDDLNAWGTILNDYLLVAHNADGTDKSAVSPGVTSLAAQAVSSTSVITLSSVAGLTVGIQLAVGVNTSTCEVRKVTAISGTTVTLSGALKWTHASAQYVVWFNFWASPTWWGAKPGDSTFDSFRNLSNMFLDLQQSSVCYGILGAGYGTAHQFYSSLPLWFPDGTKLVEFSLATYVPFALDCTLGVWSLSADSWPHQHFLYTAAQYVTVSSVDTAADTVTLSGGIGSTEGEPVAFYVREGLGTLPGGITEGRTYYVKTIPSTNTYTLSIDKWGASTVDITGGFAGEVAAFSTGNSRLHTDHVFINGRGAPGSANTTRGLNGYYGLLQQPSHLKDFRVQQFAGFGCTVGGQQSVWTAPEITLNGRGGIRWSTAEFIYLFGGNFEDNDLNMQYFDYRVDSAPGAAAGPNNALNISQVIDGAHFESPGFASSLTQTITITSIPTAGTWTLNGQTLNWNATSADVQTACDTAFGVGNTVVTGGALPGAQIQIVFQGIYQYGFGPVVTLTNTITGGSYAVSTVNPAGLQIDFRGGLGIAIKHCVDSTKTPPNGTPLSFLKTNGIAATSASYNVHGGYTLENIYSLGSTGYFVEDANRKSVLRTDGDASGAAQILHSYVATARHGGAISKQWWLAGDNNRYAAFGGVGAATWELQGAASQSDQLVKLIPGTSQTGNSLEAYSTSATLQFTVTPAGDLQLGGATGPRILAFSATPEGVFSGAPGSLCLNFNGGAATSLYVKQTAAAATTGWAGK